MISIPPDDALAASVFALGLKFGFVRREDVVRWADRRILEIESPPAWLIDLSLSRDWNLLDVISSLEKVGKGTEVDAIFKTVLGLIPEMTDLSFDAADALAKRIYDIGRHCIDDWHNPLLIEADQCARTGFLRWRECLGHQCRQLHGVLRAEAAGLRVCRSMG